VHVCETVRWLVWELVEIPPEFLSFVQLTHSPIRNCLRHGNRRDFHLYHALRTGDIGLLSTISRLNSFSLFFDALNCDEFLKDTR